MASSAALRVPAHLERRLLMQLMNTLTLAHTTVFIMVTLATSSRAKRDMRPPVYSPLQHTALFGSESIRPTACKPGRR